MAGRRGRHPLAGRREGETGETAVRTVRVPDATWERTARLGQVTGKTRSEIVREALETQLSQMEAAAG